MRFKRPHTGERRIKRKFALLPIRAGNEIRWLEFVTIQQRAYDTDFYMFPWHNVRFIDGDKNG